MQASRDLTFTVQTADGLPGSSEIAISVTDRPFCITRIVERAERPQSATSDGGAVPRETSTSLTRSA